MTPRCHHVGVVVLAVVLAAATGRADERLKDVACRSVHLFYPAAEGTAFYNEITVERSAPGTYFMVCGWAGGYFGMQELGDGKKVLLFSVWDSEQNDPRAVAADRRVKLLHKDDRVRVGRFGGEGTGGQAFFDFDWKTKQTYRFLVTAKADGDRTEYAGWFYLPDDGAWKHLVTFSAPAKGKRLRGCYSFVEDFKRDRASATKVRSARFGNGWVRTPDGKWEALTKARFTADRNPVININAARDGERFLLATGGDTKNTGARLNTTIDLPARDTRTPPEGLPELPSSSATPRPTRLDDKTTAALLEGVQRIRLDDDKDKRRQKRLLRWSLIFDTDNGEDYVKQMQALGAILAFPVKRGEYVVVRDLGKRPAEARAEDVSRFDRIFWIDDKEGSVKDVCKVLGVKGSPDHFVAFFPDKLERELLDKEGKYKGWKEDDIQETRFRVVRRGDSWEVKVIGQKRVER